MTFWLWVHILSDLLMFALDAAWWVIVFRLTHRRWLRIFVSCFMALQMIVIGDEVIGRVGANVLDFTHYIPTPILAMVTIWHYFGLPTLLLLGCIYVCWRMLRRLGSRKPKQDVPANVPLDINAVTRREFLGACAALTPPLCVFGLTGISMGQLSRFRVRRFTLSLPSLPKQLDGITIAHITDVHVGEWTHGKVLRQMVDTTNALRPDLVVVTGDLINYELSDLPEAIDLVKAMPGKYGVWMVEGNHDVMENGTEFERQVKASGIPLLLDETTTCDVRGYPVQFFGIRWMDNIGSRNNVTGLQMRELMKHRQPDAFSIFLAHHPHAFDAAIDAELPLTLTGHTHGGQLMLDNQIGVGPALFRYWSGLYKRNESQLIVSNGVGNMFPIRINAPAEIVHLTLRCA